MPHKVRDLLARQRTMMINALRGHLGEFGMVAPVGAAGLTTVVKRYREAEEGFPEPARLAVNALNAQLDGVATEVRSAEMAITESHRANPASRRLAEIPGAGPITASAIAATVADPSLFGSVRQLRSPE